MQQVFRLVIIVALVGCTKVVPSGAPSPNSNRITRADIDRSHAASALDVVRRYRSDILTARASSSVELDKKTYPVVFVDGQYFGRIDELRDIPADGIGEIRIYSGMDADRIFGRRYNAGVVQLISRTR